MCLSKKKLFSFFRKFYLFFLKSLSQNLLIFNLIIQKTILTSLIFFSHGHMGWGGHIRILRKENSGSLKQQTLSFFCSGLRPTSSRETWSRTGSLWPVVDTGWTTQQVLCSTIHLDQASWYHYKIQIMPNNFYYISNF